MMSNAKRVLEMWVKTINDFPNIKKLEICEGEFDTLRELLKELKQKGEL